MTESSMQVSGHGRVGEGVRISFQKGNGDSLMGDPGRGWLCGWIEIITCKISEDGIREIKLGQFSGSIGYYMDRDKREVPGGAVWWDFNDITQSVRLRTSCGGQKRTQMGQYRGC